jgi:UDP:flavonoid glycosyltransferase YjiC (YdhE family)
MAETLRLVRDWQPELVVYDQAEMSAPGPDDRLPDAVERLPYEDTVYVTLGTVVNKSLDVFGAVLAGLRDARLNAIVTVGPDVDPGSRPRDRSHTRSREQRVGQ